MATGKAPLRAVPDPAPPRAPRKSPARKAAARRSPAKPKSVAEAAKSEDLRALLVAMRDRVASVVADATTSPRDLAALTRRLQDIVQSLADHDAQVAAERAAAERAEVDDHYDPTAI